MGHPEYPSTLWFFRNTLLGDLLFTGLFVAATELVPARSADRPAWTGQDTP
jgi:hypothetical protein